MLKDDKRNDAPPPLVRLGPGGSYVRDYDEDDCRAPSVIVWLFWAIVAVMAIAAFLVI